MNSYYFSTSVLLLCHFFTFYRGCNFLYFSIKYVSVDNAK